MRLVTGGAVAAVFATLAFHTGEGFSKTLGDGIIAFYIAWASYFVWRDERIALETLRKDGEDRQRRSMEITLVNLGRMGESDFFINVRLANPGAKPVSVRDEWRLDITKANGDTLPMRRGEMVGEIRPLQQGEQFSVQTRFRYGRGFTHSDGVAGAKYALTVNDLEGRPLNAVKDERAERAAAAREEAAFNAVAVPHRHAWSALTDLQPAAASLLLNPNAWAERVVKRGPALVEDLVALEGLYQPTNHRSATLVSRVRELLLFAIKYAKAFLQIEIPADIQSVSNHSLLYDASMAIEDATTMLDTALPSRWTDA